MALVMGLGWSGAHAAITVSPSTIATPATPLNVASAAATGTMTTTQNGNNKVILTVGSCSGGGGTFTITPGNTVMFMDSVGLSVTYTPTMTGVRTCSVNVVYEGTSTVVETFTVTGEALVPPTIVAAPISAFNAVRVFDNAVAAHTSTRTLTISNSGDQTLNISSVSLSGDFSIDPSSANGLGATTIAGNNATRNWVIRFNPSAIGTRNGTITFNSNDPATPSKVVNLTGDGTSGEFTIAQGAGGNFGTVASGTSATLDIGVTHSGGNPKGILTFESATIVNASMSGWFSINGQPSSLNSTTTTGNVTIQCAPPVNATDIVTATVHVIADSDGSAGPGFRTTLTQDITCRGGASSLALSAPKIDFDPQLVGTTSITKTVTITNVGTSNASVSFTPNGANAGRFSVAGPGNCGTTAAPCPIPMGNGAIDVTVQFTPDAEGTVGASFQLSGGGPTVGFSVTGRGIDRHINLPDTIQVGDTFRNPGSKATRTPVPIVNSGEYPIVISALDIGGNRFVWSVAEETLAMLPITIPGLSTVDVMVRFSPTSAGKADDGQLLIVNDDLKVANGMPTVLLAGNGKNRNVDINPSAVDIGDTFAGVPTRLSITYPDDMLSVINQEISDGTNNDFVIREVRFEGDNATVFRAVDLDGESLEGRPFLAGESIRVDVVFNPSHVGLFEARLVLFLDEDPDYVKLIPVRGRALYVDAHGSGGFGCSTGGGSQGAMALLVAALGLVVRRRRR